MEEVEAKVIENRKSLLHTLVPLRIAKCVTNRGWGRKLYKNKCDLARTTSRLIAIAGRTRGGGFYHSMQEDSGEGERKKERMRVLSALTSKSFDRYWGTH